MPAFIDLRGQRFGRLLVIERVAKPEWKDAAWHCRCDCGGELVVRAGTLRNGKTRSCGCFQREGAAERISRVKFRHGLARADERRHPDFGLWKRMRQRCADTNCGDYADYGGRGITVCDRWRESFAAFLADMGPRPSKRHSIDRVDGTKGYEPGNCRWALPTTQARNRRGVVLTPEKAERIRALRSEGNSYKAISDAVGCSESAVSHVLNDGAWATESGPTAKAG